MNTLDLYKKVFKLMNALTVLATVLLFLCFTFSFDASNGYLVSGPSTTVFFIVYGAGVIVSVASIFLSNEFEYLKTPNETEHRSKMYFTASATACALFGALVFSLTSSVVDAQSFVLSGIGLLCFGLYVAFTIFLGYKFNVIKLVFLFFSIAFPVSVGIGNSRNYYHHINSIENVLTVLFCISFLIYILYEAKRICTGRHSELHFPAMLLTSMSGITLSVSYVFFFMLNGTAEGQRFYQMIMIFAISLHILFEMNRFIATAAPQSKYNKAPVRESQENDNN